MNSDPHHAANVELSDFFRLAAPLIVQMEEVAATTVNGGRRSRAHRRAATASRPPGSGARRNERERNRVRQVNAGFDRLRDHVPQGRQNRKLSKVDTLRAAVEYIGHLQELLGYRPTLSTSGDDVITDENYGIPGSVGDDVIGSWYVSPPSCGSAPVEATASMMQLLVSSGDIRVLGAQSISTSSPDRRLMVDVSCSPSPPDRSSFTGSVGCGGCSTPESLDPEVTSSSGSGHPDDDDKTLLNFESWLT